MLRYHYFNNNSVQMFLVFSKILYIFILFLFSCSLLKEIRYIISLANLE